jgi:hypothetical protein
MYLLLAKSGRQGVGRFGSFQEYVQLIGRL